jgi:hypothetical protein
MREVTNMWRNFAVNDEGGTIICSYPDTVRTPAIPIPYCEECMTGFEYALAGLMIKNGLTDEGEKMVRAVRDRYDGGKRNPWNEIECGSNYARSMASYALLGIYSGFSYDIGEGYIGFAPVRGEWGKYFFSVAESYGTVKISEDSHVISLIGKPLEVCAYKIRGEVMAVTVDGKEIEFTPIEDGARFERILVKEKLVVKRKL